MNYRDAPDGTLKQAGRFVICPVCGNRAIDFAVDNVKDIGLTEHDWACDGCRATWLRERREIKPGHTPATKQEALLHYGEMTGSDARELAWLRAQAAEADQRKREKEARSALT